MHVELRNIDAVHPYPGNPRDNDDAVGAVARSIREYGWRQPIVVDASGVVVVGHTRLKAAIKLGLLKVPVHVATDLTEAQVRAYRLADNATGEIATWNLELLPVELSTLQADGYDLGLLGFDDERLQRLLAGDGAPGLVDPDDVPPVPADPVTRPGDLWQLGCHRLLCGDSTSAEDVARLLDGAAPFLMVTDPPYGVSYDPQWRNEAGLCETGRTGVVLNDDRVDWTAAYALFPGHVAYVWHAGRFAADLVANLRAAEFEVRTQIIWRKSRFVIGRGHYHWQHEPCWYAVREGGSAKWKGDRSQSTIWDIAQRDEVSEGQTTHGTQKPVECMRRPIRHHGDSGDVVYDPFVGSGTTLIAAEQLGRRCFAMELSPAYCDVIVARWEAFTGGKAQKNVVGFKTETTPAEAEVAQAAGAREADAAGEGV